MTLRQATLCLQHGTLPARALVITFDDGYANNAVHARPILQRYGLPATVFVATGFLDGGRMWNDTVIEIVRRCKADRIDLGEFGLGSRDLSTPQLRRAAIDAMIPVVKYQSLGQRVESLRRLSQLAGQPALPDDLMMTSRQVRLMHDSGVEVGAHTVDHPILRRLPDEAALAEIVRGRETLQSLVDEPVVTFAYPNGRPDRDYDRRHVDMLRRLGFQGAVTTAPGAAAPDADRFQLPRFTPWDLDMTLWGARLVVSRLRRGCTVATRDTAD